MNRLSFEHRPSLSIIERNPLTLTKLSRLSLIAVSAHPDDEVMTLGLIRQAQQQKYVAAVTATKGEASSEYYLPGKKPSPEDLKVIRSNESQAALGSIGVRLHYLFDYPDGQLEALEHTDRFSEDLAKLAFGLSGFYGGDWAFLTLGPDGKDGHPDHIASHNAALSASIKLAQRYDGMSVPVIGHNAEGTGAYKLPITDSLRKTKMAFLRHHASQMHFVDGEPDPTFFRRFLDEYGYRQVIEEVETYDLYRPQID